MAETEIREVKARFTQDEYGRCREGMLRWALETGGDPTWQAYLTTLVLQDAEKRTAA